MALKVLQPLQHGDMVALVNPAGMLPKRFENQHKYVKTYLESIGFSVKDLVIKRNWEDAHKRSKALMKAFVDPQIKAILPLCGGKKVYEILPLLDYETLRTCPKIICGSSELSALMIAIAEKAGIITFFGPHLNFLNPKASKLENKFTVRSFWNMLQWDWHGKNGLNKNEAYHFFSAPRKTTLPVVIRNIYRNPKIIKDNRYKDNFYYTNSNKDVTGKLLIGSLESLVQLCEKSFIPDITDKIVMIDSLDMSFEAVIKLFQRFNKYCDVFSATAIVFSSLAERTDREIPLYPELKDYNHIRNFLKIVFELFGKKVPLFYGFPVGHCAYKLTLPIGITVSITVENGNLLLKELPYRQIKAE